jgi:glycosyltransferase involved in cell wall biosynthesis
MLISYIIPCYCSDLTIESCIAAIVSQNSNVDKEIIVVDSSPVDSLRKKISQFAGANIRYCRSAIQLNPGEARNLGLESAGGDYLACLDSDVVINPAWTRKMLEKHAELSRNNKLLLLGGSLTNAKETSDYLTDTLVMIEFFEVFPSQHCERRKKIPAMNLFFSAAAKKIINFPAARMAEDVMLCREFVKRGGEIYFVGDNQVEHVTRHRFVKATYMLGVGSVNFRLSTTNWIEKTLYLLAVPVGFVYKYAGILWGLLKYNPAKVAKFIYFTPALWLGMLFYNAGMFHGLIHNFAGNLVKHAEEKTAQN